MVELELGVEGRVGGGLEGKDGEEGELCVPGSKPFTRP